MLKAELRVASGKQMGKVIPLPEGKFLVGREDDCHLRPNTDLVSRHHCVFTVDEYAVRVRDLGSTNGTFVNGERIRGGIVLSSGDKVAIGKLDFEVVIGDGAGSETHTNLSLDSQTQATPPTDAPAETGTVLSVDDTPSDEGLEATQTVSDLESAQPGAAEGAPPEGFPPPPPSGDTQFMGSPGAPQMPPMGYPMQYPQQYPGQQQQYMPYGYPGFPPGMGYYPQPQMGGYTAPGYPQQPGAMPPQEAAPAEPEPPADASSSSVPSVRLPDPEETGAKEPEPEKPSEGGSKPSGPKIPDTAADIIKQYRQRRPSGN